MNAFGTAHTQHSPLESTSSCSREAQTNPCVWTGNVPTVAQVAPTTNVTFAQDVSRPRMELKIALEHRRHHLVTLYNCDVWETKLRTHNLLGNYPTIPLGLHFGFSLNILPIDVTQSPPNSASLHTFRAAFKNILNREFTSGQYIGPFT